MKSNRTSGGSTRLGVKIALAAMALGVTANAGVIVLNFNGLQDEEPVMNYYNGGLGGDGSGPGPSDGITFGADSLAIISDADGGSGNFDGAPGGDTVLFFLSGTGDLMDVPAGFTGGFSFYYSAAVDPGSVTVYSGLDGTGSVLATIPLAVTPDGKTDTQPGCSGTYDYCPWVPIGVSFGGTAESVLFSGSANYIGFDEITLGSSTAGGGPPTSGVPEPAAFGLAGLGLASLVIFRRQRKGQQAPAAQ
jgi:MYXO-CTERM domain-containing protein